MPVICGELLPLPPFPEPVSDLLQEKIILEKTKKTIEYFLIISYYKVKNIIYFESTSTFLTTSTILLPFAIICSSVQSKLIAVEIHLLNIASLGLKSCVFNFFKLSFCSEVNGYKLLASFK